MASRNLIDDTWQRMWVNVPDAAKMLGTSQPHVRFLIATKQLKAYHVGQQGRVIRILVEELRAYRERAMR
jgi:excisionase family DNA binding protein